MLGPSVGTEGYLGQCTCPCTCPCQQYTCTGRQTSTVQYTHSTSTVCLSMLTGEDTQAVRIYAVQFHIVITSGVYAIMTCQSCDMHYAGVDRLTWFQDENDLSKQF